MFGPVVLPPQTNSADSPPHDFLGLEQFGKSHVCPNAGALLARVLGEHRDELVLRDCIL